MNEELILQLIWFVFWTLFWVFIKYAFDKRKHTTNKLFEMKVQKYGYIVQNMYLLIEKDTGDIVTLNNFEWRPPKNDYIKILTKEYFDCFTYWSSEILTAYNNFLENPVDETFFKFVIKVRKDLWWKSELKWLKWLSISSRALYAIYDYNNAN